MAGMTVATTGSAGRGRRPDPRLRSRPSWPPLGHGRNRRRNRSRSRSLKEQIHSFFYALGFERSDIPANNRNWKLKKRCEDSPALCFSIWNQYGWRTRTEGQEPLANQLCWRCLSHECVFLQVHHRQIYVRSRSAESSSTVNCSVHTSSGYFTTPTPTRA